MSRRPSKRPHQAPGYKLRMPDTLRERIDKAAEANRQSANREMVNRLWLSFEHEAARKGEAVLADMEAAWARYGKVFHALADHGDLLRAAEMLVEAVEKKSNVKNAVERVKTAITVIDRDAGLNLRRFAH